MEWVRKTGRKLRDDFYKRQLPTTQTVVPMASTKTAGFGGLKDIPVVQGGSGKDLACRPSEGCGG
ncbi:MAG: hypothetical protein QXI19_00705 [Candidatus Caldarchaeum sp.]